VSELTCKEIVELVSDYLDGALTRRRRRAFEAHLAGCDGCRRYVEQMRETIRITGTLGPGAPDDEQRERLLELFRDLPDDAL
jgi:anti-sigma factor RsiW